MKAIIPTGGRGTRMRPLTYTANKHFIPVGNKPLIFYPIETVAKTGIKEVAITYNQGQLDLVKNIIGDGSRWGLHFTFILQEEPKGLANIFQICEDFVDGDSFMLHLGDNIFTDGVNNLLEEFEKKHSAGLVGIVHHPENTRLGVPYFDEQGHLVKYVEKPANPPHDYAIPGIYFFSNDVFKCFKGEDAITPSARGELEISSAFQWLIDHNYQVDTQEITGKWLDPGKIEDWMDANAYLLDVNTDTSINSELDKTVKIKGRVSIGKNCRIKNTTIKGPVSIGDNVTIDDSNIGSYTSIYNDSIIIASSVSDSVLMEGVEIDKVSRDIENSLIGPFVHVSEDKKHQNRVELLLGELSKVVL